MTGPSKLVSVIVVNYNTNERTRACLRSLYEFVGDDVEVVVVDNGSVDGSLDDIAREFPTVKLIPAGENIGFARGVNRGVQDASGELVLLLNPDTTVLPNTVAPLVEFAQRYPSYGIYGGRTLTPDGQLDPRSCWGAPSLWSLLCFALGLSTVFRGSRLFDPESLGSWDRSSQRLVPIVTGCLLLIRRDDFTVMGGMDELYFLYGEDAEFSLRAVDHGMKPVIVPGVDLVHDVGVSTGNHGRKMAMVFAGRVTLLDQRWPPAKATIGRGLLRAGVLARATVSRLAGRSPESTWRQVWAQRKMWGSGYPHAEEALFGRQPSAASKMVA